ncbi:hypothetical protein [Luteibacter sp. 9135]|nr:hypothetical protein [Luteibacter sp. 9135]
MDFFTGERMKADVALEADGHQGLSEGEYVAQALGLPSSPQLSCKAE